VALLPQGGLPSRAGRAQRRSDQRALTVSGSSWDDTLGTYEARIYLASGRGAAASGR